MMILLAMVILAGCSSEKTSKSNNEHIQEYNGKIEMVIGDKSPRIRSDIQNEGVITLTLDKDTFRNKEMIYFTILNHSPSQITFGADAFFETLVDDDWRTVRITNTASKSIEYNLEPESEGTYHLASSFLKSGTYRIVQKIKLLTADGHEGEQIELISESFEYTEK